MRFFEVVVCLKAKPEPLTGAECGSQAHGGIGGDAALAEHDFVNAARRYVRGTSECVLADFQRLQELLKQDFTRMDVG